MRNLPGASEEMHRDGLRLITQGQLETGLKLLEESVNLRPDRADQRANLAVAHLAAGNWTFAVQHLKLSLEQEPFLQSAHEHFALALLESGDAARAIQEGTRSLQFVPGSQLLHRTLGRAFAQQGQFEAAEASFEQCLQIEPDNVRSLDAASSFFVNSGREERAMVTAVRLAELCPEQAASWARLASASIRSGDLDRVLTSYRRALELEPLDQQRHSIYLHMLLMDPHQDPASLLAAHRAWPGAEETCQRHPNSPDPARRLRIGILSGELAFGSGRFFLSPLLRNLDREQLELYAYSAHPAPDESTSAYRKLFDHWREVAALSDESVVEAIRADGIDVLVDVSGHMPHRRLSVFARKPAPVQIAYPRYPSTTGLSTMDYRLTDGWADPPDAPTEREYTEKLMRVPSGYLVYDPPDDAPGVTPLPALVAARVTFGFFQSPLKLNAGVYDAISGALRGTPGSHLLVHYAVDGFDRPGSGVRERILGELAQRGIDRARVGFAGALAFSDHLDLLSRTDIALDAFPYSGQTTTCECLWMGVPVVTLTGDRFASRVSSAILHRAGLGDWVARTLDEYSAVAAEKAAGLSELSELRAGLRERLRSSAVCDGERVASEIEQAVRTAWRQWCAAASTTA